jgi:hypothetical protein
MNPSSPHHASLVRTGAAVVVLVLAAVLAGTALYPYGYGWS